MFCATLFAFISDAYLDWPSLLSSVPGELEREGWGGGPARVKPSAPIDPDLESEEELEAADAGLDLWAGTAVEERTHSLGMLRPAGC